MRWIGHPKRMDLESSWSSGVGIRVPRSLPSRSFVETSLFKFLPRAPLLAHYDRAVIEKTVPCTRVKGGGTTYYQRVKALLKKASPIDLKAGVVLDFHMQD